MGIVMAKQQQIVERPQEELLNRCGKKSGLSTRANSNNNMIVSLKNTSNKSSSFSNSAAIILNQPLDANASSIDISKSSGFHQQTNQLRLNSMSSTNTRGERKLL